MTLLRLIRCTKKRISFYFSKTILTWLRITSAFVQALACKLNLIFSLSLALAIWSIFVMKIQNYTAAVCKMCVVCAFFVHCSVLDKQNIGLLLFDIWFIYVAEAMICIPCGNVCRFTMSVFLFVRSFIRSVECYVTKINNQERNYNGQTI